MLSIFVCEDNKEQRERFTKIIQDVIMIENLDMELTLSTASPDDILTYLSENDVSGLYFLDIDLKASINGIELASKIRHHDPRGFVVFITTHSEMSYLTFIYKVEAMDYIIKDNYANIRERIHQCIMDANKKYSSKASQIQKVFSMKVGDKIINIEFGKILFFETSPTIHKVIIHTFDRQIEFYSKMKDIEEKLDNRFYRCHKSFIVNRDNIREIDLSNRCIHMVNGQECLISTRMMKGLVKEWETK
ncbi:accessory protein regulator protein A [Ruminiclostridium hungatei]|uniref:Stage 0 sporulation protein A homolog n=1 Tax=Ruminiclostridium hungatei TaxID=48256 RepID=A0A1V4SNZ0_RUMHU|nr:LytTR family DNA-binding domain-containing protein [Ruminiclostridium hungatei]OPX45186.1 accessory protein regulator protein A [Ruminiclostridium hungatei]